MRHTHIISYFSLYIVYGIDYILVLLFTKNQNNWIEVFAFCAKHRRSIPNDVWVKILFIHIFFLLHVRHVTSLANGCGCCCRCRCLHVHINTHKPTIPNTRSCRRFVCLFFISALVQHFSLVIKRHMCTDTHT